MCQALSTKRRLPGFTITIIFFWTPDSWRIYWTRCASTGAERRGGGLCADPAYVVIPQAKEKEAPTYPI
jgi:hypothetical protein